MKFKQLALLLAIIFGWQSFAVANKNTPEQQQYFHAVILMYHHVSDSTPPSTSTSPKQFVEHLNLLENEGFTVWPLERIVQHLQKRQPIPNKTIAITFDDAYKSVYETALPLLKQRQFPSTIFVNAQQANAQHSLYMNWQELKDAQNFGATIANHGFSHTHLIRKLENESTEAWQTRVGQEIDKNQEAIIQHIGKAPKLFAYPYGEYSAELQKIVQQKGYIAFGQQSGAASFNQGWLSLPRFAATGSSANLDSLKTKLYALPFPILSETPASTILDGSNLRPELKLVLAKEDYRTNQLRCYGPNAYLLDTAIKKLPDEQIEITITTTRDLHSGRPRYNCTAPHSKENRYFWFTRQWLMPHADGTWYNF